MTESRFFWDIEKEKEIASLRSKLKEANAKIKLFEVKVIGGSAMSEESGINKASAELLRDKVKELQGYLEAERSSRTDLEMFVAVLNTQKGVLQEDADKLRQELHNVCRLLEQEKMDHRELKQTWKLANEQFLEQQTMLLWEIERMKRFLTPIQLERLSKEIRQKKAVTIKTVAEEPYTVGKNDDDLMKFDVEDGTPSASSSPNARALTASDVRLIEKYSQDKSPCSTASATPDDSEDDSENNSKIPLHHVGSLEEGEELEEDSVGLGLRKSSSSSDIYKDTKDLKVLKRSSPSVKSHSQGDLSAVTGSGDGWAIINSPTGAELEKKMHLNETGWSTMKQLVDTVTTVATLGVTCMMCQNYEKQLQRLQKECVEVKDRNDLLHMALKNEKDQLCVEKEKVETLERSICTATEDAQRQMKSYNETQDYLDRQLVELAKDYDHIKEDMINQVKKLSEDRDMMTAELQRLREENASLQTINESLASSESQHIEKNKELVDDTRAQILEQQFSEFQELANSKEGELRSEVMFLKDRVMAEQFDKENMEKILQLDLDSAREEIARLKEELSIRDTGRRKEDPQD